MAHALLKAFYPPLLRQQMFDAITGDDGVVLFDGLAFPLMHFAVAIIKLPDSASPAGRRRVILSGHFDFDIHGQLTEWQAGTAISLI